MSDDDRNDLIADVADALTLDHDVQWDRCAELAAPADREKLENLRVIARVLRSRRRAGQTAAALPATGPGPRGTAFMGRLFQGLMVIAAVEVGVALLLLPWEWTDYYRQHGEMAVYITMLFLGNGVSAFLLLFAGVREPRTWLLGGYFLVRATLGPLHMLPAFLGELPATTHGRRISPGAPCANEDIRLSLRARVPLRRRVPLGVRPRVSVDPSTIPAR